MYAPHAGDQALASPQHVLESMRHSRPSPDPQRRLMIMESLCYSAPECSSAPIIFSYLYYLGVAEP